MIKSDGQRKRCEHCRSSAVHVACVTCNRSMCEDCISYGDAGKMCGLCKDREDGYKRWERQVKAGKTKLEFDEWYDINA